MPRHVPGLAGHRLASVPGCLASGAVPRRLRRGEVSLDAAVLVHAEVVRDESPLAAGIGQRLGLRCEAGRGSAILTTIYAVRAFRKQSLAAGRDALAAIYRTEEA